MKDSPPPTKRRRYGAAFWTKALRLASESRSTRAAAHVLNIDPKRIYKQQKEALTPVTAARRVELDPATATELRQLRAANRRQAQKLEIFRTNELLPFHRSTTRPLSRAAALLAGAGAG
ncbi:MAG: hypothetical protein EOO63_01720 [Hymenobacter sp.]|nr:MAG: hypothetical protein EOO63_01720 [Hymenobacter sp.]